MSQDDRAVRNCGIGRTHILGEAKRLLRYTDMNLGEIASRLDFGDNSHFIKYFKRHVGITPNAFRQLT